MFLISSAYGEGLFLALQTSLIGFFVLYYQRKQAQAFIYITLYGGIFALLLSPIVPFKVLSILQMSIIPVISVSKVSQQIFFLILFNNLIFISNNCFRFFVSLKLLNRILFLKISVCDSKMVLFFILNFSYIFVIFFFCFIWLSPDNIKNIF